MFKLDSEEALLATFRPKDRKSVQLTPEIQLCFAARTPAVAGSSPPGFAPRTPADAGSSGLFVRDYLAWKHPAGSYIYLVFAAPGGVPTGITFDANSGGGPSVPAMCDWCHCSSAGTEVGLLTARRNAKKRVGVHVCTDLGCKQKLEEEADRQGKSVLPAMAKLIERMARFATEALDIDLSGAGR